MAKNESGHLIDVAVPLPVYSLFTYRLPEDLAAEVVPGNRVVVPFGRRRLVGIAVGATKRLPEGRLRSVVAVPDDRPLLPSRLMELGLWISDYYCAPPGEVFRTMLPPGLLARPAALEHPDWERRLWPTRRLLAVLELLPGKGKATPRQREILELLRIRDLPVLLQEFLREAGCSSGLIRNLEAAGFLRTGYLDVERSPWDTPTQEIYSSGNLRHELSVDQERVLEGLGRRLEENLYRGVLLHGVTGSGKTEIYLNLIERALQRRKTALVLVPEIGLTPQISGIFRGRFGSKVAILHSALSEGERFDEWRRIFGGGARVVVGTRSAIFAPLENLGVVIVDEEHDASYKQEETPRYHARDSALRRGQLEGALVVLGSATPQLETFHLAVERKRIDLETLPGRVLERSLPRVLVVDMREEFRRQGKASLVSEALREAVELRLRKGEQVLILLNRRGYSSALLCRSCGHVETCLHCSVSLTFHQESNRLSCHYCGHSRGIPPSCGECGKAYLYYVGEGTEKVQEHLGRLFPEASIDRMDRDSVRRRGSYQAILGRFAAGRTDILVGTQMIAKGHDFPGVTLVGVLGADQALRMADFRAAERTFQLLTQVAGRAGRGERPGEVVLQTYIPDHYCLRFACSQDYRGFFEQEIRFRHRFRYPPFTALANLLVEERRRDKALSLAQQLADSVRRHRERLSSEQRMRILGPAPAVLERLKGTFRFQVLVKTTNRGELHEVIRAALEELEAERGRLRSVSVDIDPVSLL